MWPLLVVAAVAGSTSLVAKRIFANNSENPTAATGKCDKFLEESRPASGDTIQERNDLSFQSPIILKGFNGPWRESNCEKQDGIFTFSSSGSKSGSGSGSEVKSLRKKSGGSKKGASVKKRSGGLDHRVEQRKTRRKVSFCLKERKTTKNDRTKEGSLFGLGLSVGILCTMSAGKAEISRLSATMDETAKVVQELRTKLCKRPSAHNTGSLSCANKVDPTSRGVCKKLPQMGLSQERTGTRFRDFSYPSLNDDGEYPSSVLTEEPEGAMDQLEAELESELQKLPLFSYEDSAGEIRTNSTEAAVSDRHFHAIEGHMPEFHRFHGVSPSELDKKLCNLLIEQQGNQIAELENELQSAQSKLNEKEGELQALKDCVRRLTEVSLSSYSDDERDTQREQEDPGRWNYSKTESESKKAVVGMKRPIDSESWS